MMRTFLLLLAVAPMTTLGFQSSLQTLISVATKNRIQKPRPRQQQPLKSSVASFQNDTIPMTTFTLPTALTNNKNKEQQVQLLQRSAMAGISCISTWAMVQSAFGLSSIQASSIQGLVAAMVLPAPMAMASFCGSFAGMSAHCTTIQHVAVLASLTAAVYGWWDGNKIQLGKGGRMGTVAFLANVVYLLRQKSLALQVTDIMNLVRPATAVTVFASSLLLAASRRKQVTTTNEENPRSTTTSSFKTAAIAKNMSKALLLGALVSRLVLTSSSLSTVSSTLTRWLGTASAMWAASLTVKRLTPVTGVVMATSAVGLAGSFLLSNTLGPLLPAAIYLGAFLGMTGLKEFSVKSAGQASLLSAVLLELGLWNGFGGKLGWMAFLGVNFGL